MAREFAVETLEQNPRDYAYSIWVPERQVKFYFSPAPHMASDILMASPGQLAKRIASGQRWQRRYREEGRPLRYPWPDSLLETSPDEAAAELREGIKRVEGTYLLWDLSPGEAMPSLVRKGNVLSARVRSKSSKEETTPKYYEPHFRNIYLDRDGSPDLIEMHDTCPQAGWTAGEKGGRVVSKIECVHMAAMLDELWRRDYGGVAGGRKVKSKGRSPARGPFNPFGFAGNWYFDGRMYKAVNPRFASLVEDMKVARYVERESYFDINKKALSIPWILSPAMQQLIEEGRVTREVIVHGRKARKIPKGEARAQEQVFEQMHLELMLKGYKFDGRCLEFGDVALHYSHPDGHSANLVFSELPYYTLRGNDLGHIDPTAKPPQEEPFSLLGRRRVKRYEDRVMGETSVRVELPSAFRLPENGMRVKKVAVPDALRNKWRRKIDETHGDAGERMKKYAFLLY